MNTQQTEAQKYIDQYKAGQITLEQLEREIVELNPHDKSTHEHGWWFEDIQQKFSYMHDSEDSKDRIAEYLGNGSNSIISYLETPEA